MLLTRNFPPLRGGMERLLHALAGELAGRFALDLVGPAGCEAHASGARSVRSVPLKPVWKFLLGSLVAAWTVARRYRPAVILCGSGVMAPAAWVVARACRIPFVVYLHGLDIVTPHLLYQGVFLPAIRRADAVIVNSGPTAVLAGKAGVQRERIHIVHPGVTAVRPVMPADCVAWRTRHHLAGPVLLSVGRITERKGLAPFLRDCLPALVAVEPGLTLVVVGGEATLALGRTGASCLLPELKAQVARLGLEAHVRWLGEVAEAELQLAYASSNVLVFPVQELPGDVEGFGMVALEAAASGLPTVAFGVGGVPDAVDPARSGTLVTPGDAPAFVDAVLAHLHGRRAAINAQSCRAFADRFCWASRGEALAAALSSVIRPGRARA